MREATTATTATTSSPPPTTKDGFDEHGDVINPGPASAAWINPVHSAGSQNHLHNITTHTVEIDGDTAHAESYVLTVALLEPVDVWRIAVRRSTVEVMISADASGLNTPRFTAQGYSKGTRDRRDLSYVRPLELQTPTPQTW